MAQRVVLIDDIDGSEGSETVTYTVNGQEYEIDLSQKNAEKFHKLWGDIRELSLYLRDKQLQEIRPLDLEQWVAALLSENGRNLQRKTLNRKLSAVINYFAWLQHFDVITDDTTASLMNARVQSPLPDYLYESEIQTLYQAASSDPRTYLLVLLFLETGIKSQELFTLTKAHVDISNTYSPELWIKHKEKATKKDRKVTLPVQFTSVYHAYLEQYNITDTLFPLLTGLRRCSLLI
jgi:site-specific recombinase XerD